MALFAGFGNVVIERQTAAGPPAVYQTIGQVSNISLPNPERQVAVINTFDQPGGFSRRVPTVIEPGTLTFSIALDPSLPAHSGLIDLRDSGALVNWRVTFLTEQYYTFSGFVSSVSISTEADGIVTAEVTIQLDGALTVAAIP